MSPASLSDRHEDRVTNRARVLDSGGPSPRMISMGKSKGDAASQAVEHAVEWVETDRIRLFGTGAAISAVLMLICLFLPLGLLSLVAGGVLAMLAALLALLALGTWLAAKNGRAASDPKDLWDRDQADVEKADELFTGFSGFTEDGSFPPDRNQRR